MSKNILCALLCLLNAASLAQTNEEKLKTKIVHWGLHKNVTVKLNSGEKLQGRVAEIKDEFFALQVLNQSPISMRQIPFREVHKLSGHTDWDAQKARTYIGLAGAILLVVYVAVNLTRSNDRQPKTIIFSGR